MAVAATLVFASASESLAGPKPASIVIDARNGKVLHQEDPDGLRYPASLTKMMTLYLVFDALESGRISLKTKITMSKHAASQSPTKLGIGAGRSFTVEQGILSLVTLSANDCSTAFAEFLGGSEPRFGKMMTAKARSLGMSRTIYVNANGLPDSRQVTTARDQARLSLALRKHFPQYYGYFQTRSFTYGKRVIGNHNRLLGVVRGVDGIKTGFTRAAGFNLATSAKLDGRSIVAVVLGSPSGGARNAKMTRLVQAYLPKASRKGDGEAFVSMASKNAVQTAYAAPSSDDAPAMQVASADHSLDLPHKGPVPEARYDDAAQGQELQADAADTVPVIRAKTVKITKTASLDNSVGAPDTSGLSEIPERPVAETQKVDTVTTASTASSESYGKGWVIQVGTASERKEAMNILDRVKDKGGRALRSATPFAMAFSNGGAQVYRARFGGFADQNAAVNACKALKRKGVGCWAAMQ
ncbi:D-alanyl-D-alanine carboxypeptidase [Rhizobium sp. FKL33]|uniref:D-alanyl-D-alanine carboxypeptidase n=1 Tax=Rhizobium sp. FKL33 TaxID=2562307 RepID=UPI0010C00208|nr:D-alanyl-D-alanine carboxypeptidase [Rhizobium sp. FKL33]